MPGKAKNSQIICLFKNFFNAATEAVKHGKKTAVFGCFGILKTHPNAWGNLMGLTSCETFADGFRISAAFTFDTFASEDRELKNLLKGDF